jgi:hypothetical protein
VAERAAHMNQLRAELLAELGEDALDRFYEDFDAGAQPRPQLSLPWSAAPEILPPANDARVRLTAPRKLELDSKAQRAGEDGVIEFSAQGKRWRFAAAAEVILRPLLTGRDYSIDELCEAAKGTLDERTVRAFVGELILKGLVALVPSEPGH